MNKNNKGNIINKAIQVVNTIKTIWPIITASVPLIPYFLLGILIVALIMIPIMFSTQIIGALTTGVDKFVNLMSLRGFVDSETAFFDTLQKEYDKYEKFTNRIGEFDSPLIAATIHYNNLVDPEGYDNPDKYEDVKKDEFDEKNRDVSEFVVKPTEMRSFYAAANEQLGSAYTLYPGDLKLIGHLIDTRITFKCLGEKDDDAENYSDFEDWNLFETLQNMLIFYGSSLKNFDDIIVAAGDLYEDLRTHLTYSVQDTVVSITEKNLFNIIRALIAYNKQGESYLRQQFEDIIYEAEHDSFIKNLIRIINQSSLSISHCKKGQIPFPIFNKFINYERYKDYLRDEKNGYLPRRYYNVCNNCKYNLADNEEKKEIIERQIREIFEQRDAFNYLLNRRIYTQYVPGFASLPIELPTGGNWRDYISRGYQIGTARCYDNGVWNGRTDCDHLGIDFVFPLGWPVSSIADGDVLEVSFDGTGWGLYIKIGHDIDGELPYDYYTIYAHLSETMVKNGQKIGGGQQIGKVGTSGNSSGYHLHFELWDSSKTKIDPAPYLDGIVEGNSVFDTTPTD